MKMKRMGVFVAAFVCTALIGMLATTPPAQAMGGGCAGDIDGDGQTSVLDLLQVLQDFGACPKPPDPCDADLDGDGFVGTTDLLIVIGDFGCVDGDPCEGADDCDDGDPCTVDFCIAGLCFNVDIPDCE